MNLKKKLERYLRVNLLGTGPRLMKKRIYRAAVSQRLRNTGLCSAQVRTVHCDELRIARDRRGQCKYNYSCDVTPIVPCVWLDCQAAVADSEGSRLTSISK